MQNCLRFLALHNYVTIEVWTLNAVMLSICRYLRLYNRGDTFLFHCVRQIGKNTKNSHAVISGMRRAWAKISFTFSVYSGS